MTTVLPGENARMTAAHVPVGAERSSGSPGSDPIRLLRRWLEDLALATRT